MRSQRVILISPKTSFGRNLQRTYAGGLGTVNADEHSLLPPLDLLRLAGVLREDGFDVVVVDEEVASPTEPGSGDLVICHVSLASMREDARRMGQFAEAGARCFAYTSIRRLDHWQEILDLGQCVGLLLPEAVPVVGRLLRGDAQGPGLVTSENAGKEMLLAHDFGEPADEPLPARDLVDHAKYGFPALSGHRITTMNASFGCPYPCAFYCPYPLGEGKKVRTYPVARVAAEFEQCAALGITGVIFRDPIFTFHRQRTLDLCEAIKRTGTGIKWWCETRIDRLDEELIQAMVAAGCVGVEVGVESGDTRMQTEAVRKRLRLDTVRSFVDTARRHDMNIFFLLMLGLPGEDRLSITNTLRFVMSLGLRSAEFDVSVITPYPGTALHDLALRNNWISEEETSFTNYDAVMRNENLSEQDLTEAQQLVAELHRIDGGQAPEALRTEFEAQLTRWADAAGGVRA
ncbi:MULTISPECIES: AprD4 family radical SAM diol-dehydratase [unclassified Streptomyces]|uniref:AprD4 family radical SAM diol-dehydratase n=1 Tax=unclassified Streptomyces TaxID=2593676 RepID=UPI002E2834B5|nr:AprD4 family radical SAM diol-dehydratase [Streptomyces sp. NBC_00441]